MEKENNKIINSPIENTKNKTKDEVIPAPIEDTNP